MNIDAWVKRARNDPEGVAESPDAPALVLFSLARDLPSLVESNPAWTLHLFDGGAAIDALLHPPHPHLDGPPRALAGVLTLLRRDTLGDTLARYLVASGDIRANLLALTRPGLEGHLADRVWERASRDWTTARTFLSGAHDPYDERPLARLVPRENARQEHLSLPGFPAAAIHYFAHHGFGSDEAHAAWIRTAYEWHPQQDRGWYQRRTQQQLMWRNLSRENARALLETIESTILTSRARHTTELRETTLALLRLLVKAPETPADVLERVNDLLDPGPRWMRLAKYETDRAVLLKSVAQHANTPASLLRQFATSIAFLSPLLHNPSSPEEVVRPLLEANGHPFGDITTHGESLERGPGWYANLVFKRGVLHDLTSSVAHAYLNPRSTPPALSLLRREVRLTLARRAELPLEVAETLATDADTTVPETLAQASFQPMVLTLLATHDTARVRRAVASNPLTPLPILARLRHDTRNKVRNKANATLRQVLPTRNYD